MYASFIVYTGCLNNNYPQQNMQHKQPEVNPILYVRKNIIRADQYKATSAGGDTLNIRIMSFSNNNNTTQ